MTGPHPTRRVLAAVLATALAAVALSLSTAPSAGATPAPNAPPEDFGVNRVRIPHLRDAKTVEKSADRPEPAATAELATPEPEPSELRAAVVGPPAVSVSPTSGLNPAGSSTLSVTGSGFDPAANNGFGVYVAFGPVDPASYFEDANRFLAAVWMHPGGGASGSPGQGELTAAGTFSTSLPVAGGLPLTARYTDGNGVAVDCLTTQCYVITIAAHGVADRTQDTCTPVTFAGGTAVAQVDRTCHPVTTPTGQPNPGPQAGNGSPTGGSGGGSTTTGAGTNGSTSSARLPSTGSTSGTAAGFGVAFLFVGLVMVRLERRARRGKWTGVRASAH